MKSSVGTPWRINVSPTATSCPVPPRSRAAICSSDSRGYAPWMSWVSSNSVGAGSAVEPQTRSQT
jgi:hypothetical protein